MCIVHFAKLPFSAKQLKMSKIKVLLNVVHGNMISGQVDQVGLTAKELGIRRYFQMGFLRDGRHRCLSISIFVTKQGETRSEKLPGFDSPPLRFYSTCRLCLKLSVEGASVETLQLMMLHLLQLAVRWYHP